ncbi:unnamed protein product, partial [Choristocarpus tenellus]
LAYHPRYRATLTCLLPHVRAIDNRGMPPNTTGRGTPPVPLGTLPRDDSSSKPEGGGESGGGTEAGGITGPWLGAGAGVEGGVSKGRGRGGKSGERRLQAQKDEERSNGWQKVMGWRETQAERELQAQEQQANRSRHCRQPPKAAQQRQLAEEMAQPYPRHKANPDAIERAKSIATHSPPVIFGVHYRGESHSGPDRSGGGGNAITCRPGFTMTKAPPSLPTANHAHMGGEGVNSTTMGADGATTGYDDGGDSAVKGLSVMEKLARARAVALGMPLPQPQVCLPPNPIPDPTLAPVPTPAPVPTGGATSSTVATSAPSKTRPPEDGGPLLTLTKQEGGGAGRLQVTCVEGPVDAVGAAAVQGSAGGIKASLGVSQSLEEWLGDIGQEMETAVTAIQQVLLKLHDDGRAGDKKRLHEFRLAMQGMGLFTDASGPAPTSLPFQLVTLLPLATTSCAGCRLGMVKAMVKTMLHLMETEPGGSSELVCYSDFIRQQ